MNSGTDRDRIAKQGNAIAFEMEGAGVSDIFPDFIVVIEGVCDYSESQKNKQWQAYSVAAAATACTKAFLKKMKDEGYN